MARIYFLCPGEFSSSLLGLDSFSTFYPLRFQSWELSLSVPLYEDFCSSHFLRAVFLLLVRPLRSCHKVTFASFPGHRPSRSHGSPVCIPTVSCVFHTPHSIPISFQHLYASFLCCTSSLLTDSLFQGLTFIKCHVGVSLGDKEATCVAIGLSRCIWFESWKCSVQPPRAFETSDKTGHNLTHLSFL